MATTDDAERGAVEDVPQKALPEDDTEGTDQTHKRDRWSSKTTFILAAIGSAIGLGNFWRFPYLVYKHGGGPFLIPYWLSLFAIGIPMLMLEMGQGQKFQSGDVAAFGKIHPKLRGVGFASVFVSLLVVSYYSVIIAWTGVYFAESFTMPWIGQDVTCADGSVMQRSQWHFDHEVLVLSDAECRKVGQNPTASEEISWKVATSLVVTWVIVCGSVIYGVKTASKVVWVTMPLPFLLALILFFRAVTLEGAGDGIKAYIGTWEFDRLREPQIWTDAVSQIFFTLSVCFGVMTSYGSYRPTTRPILTNVFVVALTNCIFSFFCGFIVFGVLGYMAREESDRKCNLCQQQLSQAEIDMCLATCEVSVDKVAAGGFSLVFQVFPRALETMGDAGYFFSVVTFLTLFTLGWDSAFSFVEAITTVIMDTPVNGEDVRAILNRRVGKRVALPLVTILVSVACFLFGLLFAADVGFYWLDLIDHYSSNYTMLLDGLLQAVAVCWVWGVPKMRREVGETSTSWFIWSSTAAAVVLIVLAATVAIELAPCDMTRARDGTEHEVCFTGGELAIGFVGGLTFLIPGWMMSFRASGKTVAEWVGCVFFAGAEELMDFVCIVGHHRGVPLGQGRGVRDFFGSLYRVWWMFMMKYVVPVVLCFLIVLTLKQDARDRYGGYQRWMNNVMWVMCVAFSLVIFVLFALLPGDFQDVEPNPNPKELHVDDLRRLSIDKEDKKKEPINE